VRYLRLLAGAIAIWSSACGGGNTESAARAPGAEQEPKTTVLEAGAAVLQDKAPLGQLNAYLDGFHFYSGDLQQQVEAHHYCAILNEDVIQCVIYDGNGKDAKLMGVEYIVSRTVFAQFPAEEKQLWHSHVHEVRSGQLIAPGLPAAAERELMEKIAGTYGKTWHMWHTDRHHALPLGVPALMMGFTADGQIDEARLAARDRRFDVSSAQKKRERAGIQYPSIDPQADAWQKGLALQLSMERVDPPDARR
jgi:hypothetical protein